MRQRPPASPSSSFLARSSSVPFPPLFPRHLALVGCRRPQRKSEVWCMPHAGPCLLPSPHIEAVAAVLAR
eukprot:scaffold9517_cov117-Isochrysis_galbana.AAC.7